MRLAISNIAWDLAEDGAVASLLSRYDIDAIDVAPAKFFPNPMEADSSDILSLKESWEASGIEITGMQALLFGTTGFSLFGPPRVQEAMLNHLDAVCRIASELGATRLVFGSPKSRDRSSLTDDVSSEIAVTFFRKLGGIAASRGVEICLEPNPSSYGSNFMMGADDTAAIVREVAHPAIWMQLDTGALTINAEDPREVIEKHAAIIGHVHASEPHLIPLGDGGANHREVASALSTALPSVIVTIEMLPKSNEPHLAAIERALNVAIRHYRPSSLREERTE